MAIPVILDTDIGSDVDDTWALAMLMRSPELDVKLIVTATHDTVYRAKITAKLLEAAGRIDIPIGFGLRGEPQYEYQREWVEDYNLDAYTGIVHEDGVQTMIDMIRASSETITLIGIGPATNLARALELAPDIAEKCRFVGMYGSVNRGYGDDSDPIEEYNVKADPVAAQKTLSAPWQEILITPLDTCDQAILSGAHFQQIRSANDRLLEAVLENYRVWAPVVPWQTIDNIETQSSVLFDTVAIYMAYSLETLQMETMRISVTDEGMTVRDEAGTEMQVAIGWKDLPAFLAHLTERLLTSTG